MPETLSHPLVKDSHIRAVIGGKEMLFSSVAEKFHALVAECQRLSDPGSSTGIFLSDAYAQIVGMGWDVVPLLLREVESQTGHWITALTWITGRDLATPELRGNARKLRIAWIQWGIEHGYHADNSKRGLVQKKSARHIGERLRVHK